MRKRKKTQSGQAILEFGFYMLFMVPLLAGIFQVGMGLVKAVEAGEVCRNASVLTARNIDLADPQNQRLLGRTGVGLGFAASDGTPLPSGKGVVVISRVIRVGASECSQVTKPDGSPDPRAANTAECPNYGYYVFTRRITIGNSSIFYSSLGTPSSAPDTHGDITLNNYVLLSGNRAQGFPPNNFACVTDGSLPPQNGVVCLDYSKDAYVAESVFDISALNVFTVFNVSTVYSRNIT